MNWKVSSRASGGAMFLLSGPQREGAKWGKQGGWKKRQRRNRLHPQFVWLAAEIMGAESFSHHASALLPLLLSLRRPIHQRRCLPRPCPPRQEGKQGRRGGRRRENEGRAPAKPPLLGFHSLNSVWNVSLVNAQKGDFSVHPDGLEEDVGCDFWIFCSDTHRQVG